MGIYFNPQSRIGVNLDDVAAWSLFSNDGPEQTRVLLPHGKTVVLAISPEDFGKLMEQATS